MASDSSRPTQTGIHLYLSQPWSLVKSGYLVLTWITLGIHLELVGPTMSILAANVNVAFSGMGSALAWRAAGYLVANVLGAILQNIVKKHSEGLLICAFVLPAVAVFATAFTTSFKLLCVLFLIQGAAQGLTDLGGTNVLLTMWEANAAAPLNTAHLGYGIGAIIVNLFVRPFLEQERASSDLSRNTTHVNGTSLPPTSDSSANNANIFIPYSIAAAVCLLIAVGHLFFYIDAQKNRRDRLQVQQIDYAAVNTSPADSTRAEHVSPYSPKTCGRGFFQYGLTLSTVFVLYIFFIGANDQTFSKFFFSYLKFDRFHISTGAASWATILYWLSYSVGRLFGAVLSVFVSVQACLNVVWLGGFCLAVAWLLFVWVIGLTSTSLFVLGAATGLVFSPMFPLSFGLFNQRLNVVPMLIALLLCGSALGAITFQKIAGFVLDRNPNHFPTLLSVCLLASIALYIVSNVVFYLHRRSSLSNARSSATADVALPSASLAEEEQQMANYLREQQHP